MQVHVHLYMYMFIACIYIHIILHVHVYTIICMCVNLIQVMGKIGTVVGIGESGDLKVRYPENIIYILCPEAVVKVRQSCFILVYRVMKWVPTLLHIPACHTH